MSTRNAFDTDVFAHVIVQQTGFSGTFLDITPLPNARSEIVSIAITIATSAVADDRRLQINIKEGLFYFNIGQSSVLQPESTTRTYLIGQHGAMSPPGSTDKIIYLPIPSIPMIMERHVIRIILDDAHVDVWSNIGYCLKYWSYEQ